MKIDRTLHTRVSAPVAFLHAWFINHWVNHVSTNLPFTCDGASVGLSEGDLLYGCFNAAAHVMYLALSGAPLEEVWQDADRQLQCIAGRVRVAAFHCLLERQLALALQGRTTSRLSLSDDMHDEARDVASIQSTANYNQIGYYCIAKMRLHYYYGDYETACRLADDALPILPAFQGQVGEWEFVFFRALASAARAHELSGRERDALLATAQELHGQLDGWTAGGPANFAHKRDLVGAEIARARGDVEEAAAAFNLAVASATVSGFVHDLALAHERSAVFHLSAGHHGLVQSHARAAVAYYDLWQARAKSAAVHDALLGTTDGPA